MWWLLIFYPAQNLQSSSLAGFVNEVITSGKEISGFTNKVITSGKEVFSHNSWFLKLTKHCKINKPLSRNHTIKSKLMYFDLLLSLISHTWKHDDLATVILKYPCTPQDKSKNLGLFISLWIPNFLMERVAT